MSASINISETDNFGVTLMLFNCAFSAEVRRDSLCEIMQQIEERLTADGVPDDSESRVELMLNSVTEMSAMVANQQIDHDDAIADIAFSFIYCLGKTVGFEQVPNVRGLTGSYLKNVLSLNPCLGELEYQTEMAMLQQAMDESPDGDWAAPSISPTIH